MLFCSGEFILHRGNQELSDINQRRWRIVKGDQVAIFTVSSYRRNCRQK